MFHRLWTLIRKELQSLLREPQTKVADDKVWARKLFVFSIVAITALSVMMSVDFMVPDSHSLLAYVR